MAVDQAERARLSALETGSRALFELVGTDPEARATIAGDGPLPDRDAYAVTMRHAAARGGGGELRIQKRRALLAVAARDLAGELTLEEVGEALADLADACVAAALELVGDDGLAVVAMGKLGACELNYFSDIDVMFVGEGDPGDHARSAERLLRLLSDFTPEGQLYPVDANLRPEGAAGALVRSVEGYVEYYRRWAKVWEHQALIKARACAGHPELGRRLVDATRPMVFPEDITGERVAEVRHMKQRVEAHAVKAARRARGAHDRGDVKLGPGGIRDIEFSIQLLQLVHGGSDHRVREPSTLRALPALVDGGYIAEEDGAGLSIAYRWLRGVEHRLQLWQERRTHRLPADDEGRARVARALGFKDSPQASALQRFDHVHASVLADVRARFERLFYRPMIEALADGQGPRLSRAALSERLRILGFRDVERAARTIEGLVTGTSRRARLLRLLAPAYLRFVAGAPLPDDGLFAFLRLGEALGGRIDALNLLRDNPPGLEFLARFLGSGRILGEVLEHVPEELNSIAELRFPEQPKSREQLVHEAKASLGWRDPKHRLDGLRRFKRRALLHVAMADVGGRATVEYVGAGLADLADACLEAALDPADLPFAVIGMGKLGGRELNYSSDIDVMFVHDGAQADAEHAAEDLLRAIGEVTPEGQAFRIDANLRPEGRSGPLTRSLDSYVEYFDRWARPWEFQALTKARVAAGDPDLGRAFIEAARSFVFRDELSRDALTEIQHLKARMERERIPRGMDPRRHLKLGPGGLSDIEFSAQMLQLRRGASVDALRSTSTLGALDAARAAELIDDEEAARLSEAYRFLMRLRNRLFFAMGRPVDALPVRPEDLESLGIAMGFEDQPRQELEDAYLRYTRRARRVAEAVIFARG